MVLIIGLFRSPLKTRNIYVCQQNYTSNRQQKAKFNIQFHTRIHRFKGNPANYVYEVKDGKRGLALESNGRLGKKNKKGVKNKQPYTQDRTQTVFVLYNGFKGI